MEEWRYSSYCVHALLQPTYHQKACTCCLHIIWIITVSSRKHPSWKIHVMQRKDTRTNRGQKVCTSLVCCSLLHNCVLRYCYITHIILYFCITCLVYYCLYHSVETAVVCPNDIACSLPGQSWHVSFLWTIFYSASHIYDEC